MTNDEFDRALVSAAFTLAAERGWDQVSVVRAARAADLKLDRARARFIGKAGVLARFGRIADQNALSLATTEGSTRDRLFDLLMRRFDTLQAHREGVLALRTYLPRQPGLALCLAAAHMVSMAFMLEGAGIPASGLRGRVRTKGLVAVWLATARAWERDESPDLSGTMAALDKALDRAEQAEKWLRWNTAAPPPPAEPPSEAPFDEPPPSDPPPIEGESA
jgi:hypothetical protein